jgi:hypothetical protein
LSYHHAQLGRMKKQGDSTLADRPSRLLCEGRRE